MSSIDNKINVVNVQGLTKKESSCIVYVGRKRGHWQGSTLANPFRIGVNGNRKEVINKYRIWLEQKLKTDQRVQCAIMNIVWMLHANEQVRLGCWCASLPCYAEVIKEVAIAHYKNLFD